MVDDLIDYTDVLADLHATRHPRTYLEIGVFQGATLRLAGDETLCVGVDPEPILEIVDGRHHQIEKATSDDFFAGPRPRELFGDEPVDLAFIDGMHLFEYALRDFLNTEALSGPGSLIVVHDVLPLSEVTARRDRTTVDWTGDIWKLVLCLLDRRPDLALSIIDVPPSGLCLVSGLDPKNRVLGDDYDAIVEQYLPMTYEQWQDCLPRVVAATAHNDTTRLWALRTELEQAAAAFAETEASLGDARRRLDDLHQSLSAEQAATTAEARRRADVEGRLAAALTEVAHLRGQVVEERARLAIVSSSLSWRLTSPVRFMGRLAHRSRGSASPPAVSGVGGDAAQSGEGPTASLDGGLPADQFDPLVLAAEARKLEYRPLISIIVPVYNTSPRYLELAVESVMAQAYPEWELCICDDGSSNRETLAAIKDLAANDSRIRVTFLGRNQGIAAASNTALAMAHGEYVAMLDHDDELSPAALLEVVKALNADSALDVVYTDQDYVLPDGTVARSFRKPDWSQEMFRGVMYVGHLLVVRRTLAEDIGGFDSLYDNVQDFEFMLRLSERTQKIGHVPHVAYHWRMIPGSVAFGGDQKGHIEQRQAAAVNAHLERCSVPAKAHSNPAHAHRLIIVPTPRAEHPLISVVVLGAGTGSPVDDCVASIRANSDYPAVEIIAAGDKLSGDVAKRLMDLDVRLEAPGADPGTAAIAAASGAKGRLLVFVDASVRVEQPDWLDHLFLDCELPGVACVTPVIVGPAGDVQSAGFTFAASELPRPALAGWPAESDGNAGTLSCVREVSAVSNACFAILRERLDELGGLSPYFESTLHQSIDLSLRASARGLRNLCTPRVCLRSQRPATGMSQASDLDQLLLLDAWEPVLKRGDPFWNPDIDLSPSAAGL